MKLPKIIVGEWVWVLYPLLVLGLVIFSINYFSTSGDLSMVKFTAKQEETQAAEKVVNELKAKLGQLKGVNKSQSLEDLKKMLVAMPASKKAWLLVAELQKAATTSYSVVSSYKADVGDVTEASEGSKLADQIYNSPLAVRVDYELSNFDQMVTIMRILNESMPLVKVNKVDFGMTLATITIESGWLPWKLITPADAATMLPDYKSEVKKALDSIASLEEVSTGDMMIVAATTSAF